VSAISWTPSAQEKRFAANISRLSQSVGHADRKIPLKNYCTGLLLPGERKGVQPMAARLAPSSAGRLSQSLNHLVADAPWSDEALLKHVRSCVQPAMEKSGPIIAWIVADTVFRKKGTHSAGVAQQENGQAGKAENSQVAVSLSVATWSSSLPIAWRLYLPESWARDRRRRSEVGVPEEVRFQTKPQIALEQIRQAVSEQVPRGVVAAGACYGMERGFRAGVSALGLPYVAEVQSSVMVWAQGQQSSPTEKRHLRSRAARRSVREEKMQILSAQELALALPPWAWKSASWRQGIRGAFSSLFAAVRVRCAYRKNRNATSQAEEWLLIDWPRGEAQPTRYWLSTLRSDTPLPDLVKLAKHDWIVERDSRELKEEVGLENYEGRGWRGVHHHATLCIAAYGFLVAERNGFSPLTRVGRVELPRPEISRDFSPRALVA